MGTIGVSSSVAGQCAPPWSCQIQLRHRCTRRSKDLLAYHQKLEMELCALPRLSCPVKHRMCMIRMGRLGSGVIGSRPFDSDERRLGFVSVRTAVVRAQEEDKEHQELDKVADKSSESWTSSVQRANMVSRIFMATFVWISLFFGMSLANNEMGGGRPGRRGPRK